MSSDYYSYQPLLRLTRPLTLAGIPGAGTGATARAMNLVSGLPFVWLDRRVEHLLGHSVELAQDPASVSERLQAERTLVDEALSARQPPVIALSDATYADAGLRDRLEADTDVVLLHVDVDSAIARIRRAAAKDVRQHWALTEGGQADAATLRLRLLDLERQFRHLSRVVLVRDRTPLEVARDLLAQLGMAE